MPDIEVGVTPSAQIRATLTHAFRKASAFWVLFRAWHLLSLDAPTVAVVWALLLVHTAGVAICAADLIILGVGTWLVYVADRLLDGLPGRDPAHLRERHHFYAQWRSAILSAAAIASLFLTVLVAFRMRSELRRADAGIFAVALIYLAAVHHSRGVSFIGRGKEAVVAILFAAACAAPAWTTSGTKRGVLLAGTILLAALCWLNCLAIEYWEDTPRRRGRLWLRAMTLALTSAAMASIPDLRAPASVVAASALVLLGLDRTQLPPQTLRVLADVALLTPLFALR